MKQLENHVEQFVSNFSKALTRENLVDEFLKSKSPILARGGKEQSNMENFKSGKVETTCNDASYALLSQACYEYTLPVCRSELVKMLSEDEIITRWSSGRFFKQDNSYRLYDGLINYVKVDQGPGFINQKWKLGEWKEYSNICFDFSDSSKTTTHIKIIIKGMPENLCEKMEEFFNIYYWNPIRRFLGIF